VNVCVCFHVTLRLTVLLCHGVLVQHKPLKNLDGQVCEICGDGVGLTVDGDLFVACNECGFPVCRPCYEYERREGGQLCPQCKTRYKRLKGKPSTDIMDMSLFVYHLFILFYEIVS